MNHRFGAPRSRVGPPFRRPPAVLVALAIILPAGCSSDPRDGYSFTSSYRDDIRTVAVPMFQNDTFSHGLEALLTEAIVKEIHRTTPWAVSGATGAQTTLTGVITRVDLRKLSTNRDSGLVEEMAVDMAVDFQWVDNRSGESLVSRRNFRAANTFVPDIRAGELLAAGEQGAIEAMARDIVSELRSQW